MQKIHKHIIQKIGTTTIIKEIQKLPFSQKKEIAEWLIKTIKQRETKSQIEIAAEELCVDYETNNNLTTFTTHDIEDFYEAANGIINSNRS